MQVLDGKGQGRQQLGRTPPPPDYLRVVLAPGDLVWERLERPFARRLVEAAVRRELGGVVGFGHRADAPQVLANRLARRLADQMRLGRVLEANQTGSSSSGWTTTKVLSESLRSLIIMNSASSEGSSMRSPFSLSAP
ncbi:hypothetical protein [Streptomyces sp. NPDC091294]|uniref:hypothetical protein n=1 Tax=Streptomyces sp. NPDC091294 TaxID=3365992 RepID=UPI003821BE81